MKRFVNLLIIVILIYTVSVMPINTAVFGIDFSRIFSPDSTVQEPSQDLKVQYAITRESQATYRLNPLSYTVLIDANKNMEPDDILEMMDIQLVVSNVNKSAVTYSKEALKPQLKAQSGRYALSLDLSQVNLNLSYDNYFFALKIGVGEEDDFSVFYSNSAIAPNGKSASSVSQDLSPYYYADQTGTLSIPTYVQTQPGSNPFRRLINTLNQAPSHVIFSDEEAFPAVGNIWYSAGLLDLRLNSLAIESFTDEERARMALNNLLLTAAHTERDVIVNKVRLSVNGSSQSRAFGTLDITQDFEVNRSPQAFVALIDRGQLVWIPKPVNESDSLTETVQQLLSGLSTPQFYVKDPRVVAIMPAPIEVEQATLLNQTLKVRFNKEITSCFGDNEKLIRAFLEGLSLSLTSIPLVENVELFVGDSRITSLSTVLISVPLVRPDYYNVFE